MKRIMILALVLLMLSGCASKIGDIMDDPKSYSEKDVTLKGTVVNAIKLGSFSGFTLDDGTGKTFVSWDGSIPKEGDEVTVRGTVVTKEFFGERVFIEASEVN